MSERVTQITDNIFTVAAVFNGQECEELIAHGEALGFEAASVNTPVGPQMLPVVRNNDRVIFHDPELAELLWERTRAFIPPQWNGWQVSGLGEDLRFYRYDPGQRFKRHKDGSKERPGGEQSRLSFLIYLNEGCEGGETIFRDYQDVNGEPEKEERIITPHTGMGLFFKHELWHEGAILQRGRKYVLRTNVFYRPPATV